MAASCDYMSVLECHKKERQPVIVSSGSGVSKQATQPDVISVAVSRDYTCVLDCHNKPASLSLCLLAQV